MNSYVRNAISNDLFADFEQEKAPDTTEALLESCSTADSSHKVFRQYGCSTTPLYTVNEPLIIGHQLVEGWLALPMRNCAGELTSLSFISPSKADKSIYFTNDNLKGCVILGKPLKDKPLFVVCDPEAAFAISRSGLPCLLTQSPYVRNGKNRAVGGDCADMGNIINEWSNSGYTQIYAPVGCDLASTYKLLLKECKVHVLGLALPIDQYIESSVLKSELLKLIDAKK